MGEYLKLNILDKKYNDKNIFESRLLPFANSELKFSNLIKAELLTHGEDVKTVYDLTLSLNEKFDYLPGDTIGILAQNNLDEVNNLLDRLNLTGVADNEYCLSILEGTIKKNPTLPKHVPKNGSIRNIFVNNIDIRTPPKKLFLKNLLIHTSDSKDSDFLKHITSTLGTQDYMKFINNEGRTLLGLLNILSSCLPPVEIIIENSVNLQPRPYSISSSPLLNNKLNITFFVTEISKNVKGVCTGWLENIIKDKSDVKIPFYFRKPNNFRLALDFHVPLILIGTGTGIAPFIGFLKSLELGKPQHLEDIWLFHGFRYTDRDALYKNEISDYCKSVLTKYFACCSREDNKVYVQHKIKENGKGFIDLVMVKGASIFICGNLKTVVKDVKSTILKLLGTYGKLNEQDAKNYLAQLETNKKLLVDSW
ncbi:unnamed protein product [Brassicogethes aeneus]|uniref:Methionine synthase reductase n=1 Tax=Brassicogethes aeneus TaxID=1431903 RepID=A0A9P0FEX3_BRAAE|nr:unnamed protein product [Brassicogethes aeneus]